MKRDNNNKKIIHYRGRKIYKKKFNNSYINKTNIVYFFIGLCDIILVIFCARQNKIHYVRFLGENIFVGKTKNLIFGRNYINLIITLFFYIYVILVNKFFLKKGISKVFLIWTFLLIFIVNIILFCCFSYKVY